jgi:hypothetical protein
MTAGDAYRKKAARFDALAKQTSNARIRAEWDTIAKAYRRLAQLADRNAQTDIFYETPSKVTLRQPEQQQQSKKNDPKS